MRDSDIAHYESQTVGNDQAVQVYMTPQLRSQLGWMADRVPDWAAGSQDVLLISSADLAAARPAEETIGDFKSTIPGQHLLGLIDPHTSSLIMDKILNSAGYEERKVANISLMGNINSETDGSDGEISSTPATNYHVISELGSLLIPSIQNNRAFALHVGFSDIFKQDAIADSRNLCIISMPDMTLDAHEYAAQIAGVSTWPAEHAGTAEEWQMIILAHEATHCTDTSFHSTENIDPQTVLNGEIYADRKALNIYRQELEAGTVKTQNLTEIFTAVRAIGAVQNFITSHATSMAIDHHNHDHDHDHDHHYDVNDIGALHDEVIAFMRDEAGMPHINAVQAMRYLRDDPALLHEIVRQLDHRDAFADNPAAQRLARQYLEAAATYVPDYFETELEGSAVESRIGPLQQAIPEPLNTEAPFSLMNVWQQETDPGHIAANEPQSPEIKSPAGNLTKPNWGL